MYRTIHQYSTYKGIVKSGKFTPKYGDEKQDYPFVSDRLGFLNYGFSYESKFIHLKYIVMTTTKSNSKSWGIALWAAQIVLAAMFFMAGLPKATTPIQDLAATMPLAVEAPEVLVRFIGISELLAAFGLVLPGMLRIKPVLIPLAAAGLLVIMVLAIIYHLAKGEVVPAGINVGLALLAAFVAWGRFSKAPIPAASRSAVHG